MNGSLPGSRSWLVWPARALLVALPFLLLAVVVRAGVGQSGPVVQEAPSPEPVKDSVFVPQSLAPIASPTPMAFVMAPAGPPLIATIRIVVVEPMEAGTSQSTTWTCGLGMFQGISIPLISGSIGVRSGDPLPIPTCPWPAGTIVVEYAGPAERGPFVLFPAHGGATGIAMEIEPTADGQTIQIERSTGVDCQPSSIHRAGLHCTLTAPDARVTVTTAP